MIKCEVRVTGNESFMDGKVLILARPDAAEVTITNTSAETLDIGSVHGPEGHLDLKLKDPKGENVKTLALSSLFSPLSFTAEPCLLKTGESKKLPVCLLVMLPEEKRVPGTYKVKARYTVNKKDYESAEVEVKWPGEKK